MSRAGCPPAGREDETISNQRFNRPISYCTQLLHEWCYAALILPSLFPRAASLVQYSVYYLPYRHARNTQKEMVDVTSGVEGGPREEREAQSRTVGQKTAWIM